MVSIVSRGWQRDLLGISLVFIYLYFVFLINFSLFQKRIVCCLCRGLVGELVTNYSSERQHHRRRKSKWEQHNSAVFEFFRQRFAAITQEYSNRNGVVPRHCRCNVEFSGETKGLIRFMAPMPEAVWLCNLTKRVENVQRVRSNKKVEFKS